MDIIQLDEKGCLFISPDIDDWSLVEERDICAIIDMDGDLDIGVPAPQLPATEKTQRKIGRCNPWP